MLLPGVTEVRGAIHGGCRLRGAPVTSHPRKMGRASWMGLGVLDLTRDNDPFHHKPEPPVGFGLGDPGKGAGAPLHHLPSTRSAGQDLKLRRPNEPNESTGAEEFRTTEGRRLETKTYHEDGGFGQGGLLPCVLVLSWFRLSRSFKCHLSASASYCCMGCSRKNTTTCVVLRRYLQCLLTQTMLHDVACNKLSHHSCGSWSSLQCPAEFTRRRHRRGRPKTADSVRDPNLVNQSG